MTMRPTLKRQMLDLAAAWGLHLPGPKPPRPRIVPCAPVVPVASLAAGGKGTIIGRVRAVEPLTAPLSGRPCVFFHLGVWRGSGGDRRRTAEIQAGAPFEIVDATGAVVAPGERVRAWIEGDECRKVAPLGDVPRGLHPAIDELRSDAGASAAGDLLIESVLAEDRLIAAWGHFHAKAGEAAYRARPASAIVLEPVDEGSPWLSTEIVSVLEALGIVL